MKYFSFSFLLFSLSISAAFDDYLNLNSFLKQSDVNNDKVFVLLNNKRLFSTDYHPSSYIRARDEYPRYPSTMIKRGIEGYAEIEFTINPDGSTSNHKVIESMPGSYFDKNSLIEAKGLRYTKNINSSYSNSEGSKHKHRFTFNLPEEARKVPNSVFSCMDLIYQDRYIDAKRCSEKRVSLHSGYTVPYAMALYYLQEQEQAIDLLTKLIKNPQEESFYVKALSASAVSIFLFSEKSYQKIIELEPFFVHIRKVGYEEAMLNAFYFLGVSLFYGNNTIDSLYYLKLTQQDSNCKISSMNSNDDIKAKKAQSLFRLIPEKNCYFEQYTRTEETLKAIDKLI